MNRLQEVLQWKNHSTPRTFYSRCYKCSQGNSQNIQHIIHSWTLELSPAEKELSRLQCPSLGIYASPAFSFFPPPTLFLPKPLSICNKMKHSNTLFSFGENGSCSFSFSPLLLSLVSYQVIAADLTQWFLLWCVAIEAFWGNISLSTREWNHREADHLVSNSAFD